ncbi:MAG: hypothetical protein AAGA58_17900 [Verrucomicrobiota bacterium]
MRDKIWNLLCLSEYNSSYWNRYENKLRRIDIVLKIILALGSVIGVGAWAANSEYQTFSAVMSAVCGLLATVILPAISWTGLVDRIQGVRHRWIDIKRQAQDLWDDCIDGEPPTSAKKKLKTLQASKDDLEKISFWLRSDNKLKKEAHDEAVLALSNY